MPTGYAYGNDHNHNHNWHPANCGDADDYPVPEDLLKYYRRIEAHKWVYVCPHCKMQFEPGWGGMPDSFRKHVTDPDYNGAGCTLKPPAKEQKRKTTTKGLDSFG